MLVCVFIAIGHIDSGTTILPWIQRYGLLEEKPVIRKGDDEQTQD
jgi:hypothetical protein